MATKADYNFNVCVFEYFISLFILNTMHIYTECGLSLLCCL